MANESWLVEHRSWLANACLAAASALGLVLLGLSTLEATHDAPRWLTVLDPAWAVVAFAGVATYRGSLMVAVAVWGFLGTAIAAIWLVGLGLGAPAGLVWLHLAIAVCFVGLAIVGGAAHD
jgi:hypothetical protein